MKESLAPELKDEKLLNSLVEKKDNSDRNGYHFIYLLEKFNVKIPRDIAERLPIKY